MEAQSLPHHVVICIQQQPPALALDGWGCRRELRKKEGAVVLDKETIDFSAFSPALNWDGDKIKSLGRKPTGDLQHWSTSLVLEVAHLSRNELPEYLKFSPFLPEFRH